jgi:hypothetical protein
MPLNPQPIPPEDLDALAQAYRDLLTDRQNMIDRTASLDDSTYFREVIVDSIISGLMEHFQEFARMPQEHQEEIHAWGGALLPYIENRVNQINAILTQLPAAANAAPRATPDGRQPGRGRDGGSTPTP